MQDRQEKQDSHDLIWILDNDPTCVTLYQQTLGLQYHLRAFSTVDDCMSACARLDPNEGPRILIADPENTNGSLVEFLRRNREEGGVPRFPEYIIASRLDDLELIRFYLKAGARDYILKPLRPNELVAKVERALNQISNREIFILRNDLDGISVSDLTFREHQLLTIFLSRPGRSVKRDDLYGAIWTKVTVNKKTLDVHLFNLRRKLRPHGYDIICQGQVFMLCRQMPNQVVKSSMEN